MDTQNITFSKKCIKCAIDKPLTDFRKQKTCKDGLNPYCSSCMTEYNHKRYEAKKIEIIARVKSWQGQHKDKVRAYRKKYRESKRKTQCKS